MMCSIRGREFATPRFGVRVGSGMGPFDSPPMGSYYVHIDTSVYRFDTGSKSVSGCLPVCPFDPDTMTNTTLEASYRFVDRQ